MNDGFHSIPECGWACRLDPNEDTGEGAANRTIDLSDGSNLTLTEEGDAYLWYDIEGDLIEQFLKGTEDFDAWAEVHAKLRALEPAAG